MSSLGSLRRKVKDREIRNSRGVLGGLLGLALSVWLVGFTASPAMALSITGSYTDIASASLGTTGPLIGLVTGQGGPFGSSLAGGFPNVTALGHNFWPATLGTGVIADSFGTRADNATRLTLNVWSHLFAQGHVSDSTRYLATHRAAAFSNPAPRTFLPSGDDHPFLFSDGTLGLDDGGVKAIAAPVAMAFALTGQHELDLLDLFFADVHVRQAGPAPSKLLLFGAALVGLGAVVRRRMRGAANPND
jgi:hypothetical protein